MVNVFRKLSPNERELIKPFLDEYLSAAEHMAHVKDRMERVLRLAEPRFNEPGVSFDPETLAFYETLPDPEPEEVAE